MLIIIGAACADRIGRGVVDDDSAVSTETKWGTAILLLDGKPVRTPLVPETAGVLSGDTGVAVPEAVKGVVQLTDPEGKTVQAKF